MTDTPTRRSRRTWRTTIVLLILLGLIGTAPLNASDDRASADGYDDPADVDEVCVAGQPGVVYGTRGPDVLHGTAGDDVICGLGGRDLLIGGRGNDQLHGGRGNDWIKGWNGDDTVDGGDGRDVIDTGRGDDLADGGSGDDLILGGVGHDELSGGPGRDLVRGGLENDSLDGGDGNDNLEGSWGDDRMFGGAGDDDLGGSLGADLLNGGDGTDVLDGGGGAEDVCVFGETLLRCEKDDGDVLPTEPDTVQLEPDPAGTVRFEGGPGLEDLVVEVNSAGGLSADQIQVRPDRQATFGLSALAASPAYDISVPDPAAVLGATITLPYDPSHLDGGPEEDLRIASFDEQAQLWLPVDAPTTVDVTNKTVTVGVEHFSMYAVVQHATDAFWDAQAIEDLFGATPVPCTPDAGDANVDVVFAIDTSGSMLDNDPDALRVDAAKTFLARLRAGDRAAVVDFDDIATTRIGLTDVTDQADRANVEAALDATADATGGTNITAAVASTTDILAANGGGGRIRAAILLTDGESDYDTAETTRAAQEAVTIYTVGLGDDAGQQLLEGIATGTGGRAFTAETADQLAAIYDELVGSIIDPGVDTDGDTLTDCEETNGLFSPVNVFLPELGVNSPLDDLAEFTFPDPHTAQSDGDGTADGQEVRRARFSDNPDLAQAFHILVDAGRDDYFIQVTGRPDKTDSDNDGLQDPTLPRQFEDCPTHPDPGPSSFSFDSDRDDVGDGVECVNGTDPLRPDFGDYGVDGLAPFTLFTPEDYKFEHRPVVPVIYQTDEDEVRLFLANDSPVFYDADFNCTDNCEALERYAADKADDNGVFGVCLGGRGDCEDDASQIRDKVRHVVEEQRVFADDGDLRTDYIATSATFLCLSSYRSTGQCGFNGMKDAADDVARDLRAPDLDKGKSDTLRRRLGDRIRQLDPAKIGQIVNIFELTHKVFRDAERDPTERRRAIERAVRACTATDVVAQIGFFGNQHPCEVLPIFLPGQVDAGAAARQTARAIDNDPSKRVLVYASTAERDPVVRAALQADGKPSSRPRQWYRQYDSCADYDTDVLECDEYPYYASVRGGPPLRSQQHPDGSEIEPVVKDDNRAEGLGYGAFTKACGTVRNAPRSPFIVVPLVDTAAAPTDFVCSR